MKFQLYLLIALMTLALPAFADDAKKPTCAATDTACLLSDLQSLTSTIDDKNWRDQTNRELAKMLTHTHRENEAIALIAKIENPDTKAMTIRGIGMAAASQKWNKTEYDALFSKLATEAEKITHPPSYGIALTYIAMAQAFAGDDASAIATAQRMENPDLRKKAFGETAEIQAERGDLAAVQATLTHIDDIPYRDKEAAIITKIFADRKQFDSAVAMGNSITAPYHRANALLYTIGKQIAPDEVLSGE